MAPGGCEGFYGTGSAFIDWTRAVQFEQVCQLQLGAVDDDACEPNRREVTRGNVVHLKAMRGKTERRNGREMDLREAH